MGFFNCALLTKRHCYNSTPDEPSEPIVFPNGNAYSVKYPASLRVTALIPTSTAQSDTTASWVSDSDAVEIVSVSGNVNLDAYVDGKHSSTALIQAKAVGEAHITVSTSDGQSANCVIKVERPDSFTTDTRGFVFYSDEVSNSITVGKTSNFFVGYHQNNRLVTDVKEYIVAVSDSDLVSVDVGNWDSMYGRQYQLRGKKRGYTSITFTNPQNGDSKVLEVSVMPAEAGYSFQDIPEKEYEEGKITNFFNYNGLVVNDFAYKAHKDASGALDYYSVSMTVYNAKNLYGAVTAYDSEGKIYSFKVIDKKTDNPSSIVDTFTGLYYSVSDVFHLLNNKSFYSGKSITEETEVSLRVPPDGYLVISNNAGQSEVVCAASFIGMIFETANTLSTTLGSNAVSLLEYSLVEALTEDYAKEALLDVIKDTVTDGFKSGNVGSPSDFSQTMANITDKLTALGINLVESIDEKIISMEGAGSVGESFIKNLLPTGKIINLFLAVLQTEDFIFFYKNMIDSMSFSKGIYIYPPVTGDSYQSNGVSVTPSNGTVENAIVHAYAISTEDVVSETSPDAPAKPQTFSDENAKTYSITMYRGGEKIQSDSEVEVKIPVPEEFKAVDASRIKVFRLNDDGTVTDMIATVLNGYAVFTTPHFSYYSIVCGDKPYIALYKIDRAHGVTLKGMAYSGTTTTAYCAFYNDSGKMVDLQIKSLTTGENDLTFPVTSNFATTAKFFILDSQWIPQCGSARIKIT